MPRLRVGERVVIPLDTNACPPDWLNRAGTVAEIFEPASDTRWALCYAVQLDNQAEWVAVRESWLRIQTIEEFKQQIDSGDDGGGSMDYVTGRH